MTMGRARRPRVTGAGSARTRRRRLPAALLGLVVISLGVVGGGASTATAEPGCSDGVVCHDYGPPVWKSAANNRYISVEEGYTGGSQGMLRARATQQGEWEVVSSVPVPNVVDGTTSCATAPPPGWRCVGSVAIYAHHAQRFVSAELGYGGGNYGMLRARASAIGPWEKYDKYVYGNNEYAAYRSQANGLFVSAELGYGGSDYGMLRARAGAIGPWERYWGDV